MCILTNTFDCSIRDNTSDGMGGTGVGMGVGAGVDTSNGSCNDTGPGRGDGINTRGDTRCG